MIRPFLNPSRIGFGCASLGSRVDAAVGLKALEEAFEGGVNWFDLAPSYGDGAAEAIFAQFARGRRERLYVCTKCGIAPPAIGPTARMLRPLARAVLRRLPATRSLAAVRPAPVRISLTGETILQSLAASLRRLKTDYVDVLALHDPELPELERDDVARALEQAITSGMARVAGVAGGVDAAVRAVENGLPVRHLQFTASAVSDGLGRVRGALGARFPEVLLVTHSVFSPVTRPRPIAASLERGLGALGYTGPPLDKLRAATLDLALAENAQGVVLLSMFSRTHLEANLRHLSDSGWTIDENRLRSLLLGGAH